MEKYLQFVKKYFLNLMCFLLVLSSIGLLLAQNATQTIKEGKGEDVSFDSVERMAAVYDSTLLPLYESVLYNKTKKAEYSSITVHSQTLISDEEQFVEEELLTAIDGEVIYMRADQKWRIKVETSDGEKMLHMDISKEFYVTPNCFLYRVLNLNTDLPYEDLAHELSFPESAAGEAFLKGVFSGKLIGQWVDLSNIPEWREFCEWSIELTIEGFEILMDFVNQEQVGNLNWYFTVGNHPCVTYSTREMGVCVQGSVMYSNVNNTEIKTIDPKRAMKL